MERTRKILRFFPKYVRNFFFKLLNLLGEFEKQKKEIEQLESFVFRQVYNSTLNIQKEKVDLNKKESKVYSQHGEDGILAYVFSQIGVKNGTFVEFGIGDGRECNTANLSINFGWCGLLMESDTKYIERARKYYKKILKDRASDVSIVKSKITMENINQILLENRMEGEIDLLSIDIDGNDYWVWKAINVIKPRVVIIEYNATFGSVKSITIPYNPNFDYKLVLKHSQGLYHGASLKALTKLAHSRGYILVCCDSSGTNAFFIRKDLASGKFSEVSVKEAYYPQYSRIRRFKLNSKEQFALIKDLKFETI